MKLIERASEVDATIVATRDYHPIGMPMLISYKGRVGGGYAFSTALRIRCGVLTYFRLALLPLGACSCRIVPLTPPPTHPPKVGVT